MTDDRAARANGERWQYGVEFADRSVGWRWSGATSRERAERVIAKYPNETHLVRRPVDDRGRPIGEPERVES